MGERYGKVMVWVPTGPRGHVGTGFGVRWGRGGCHGDFDPDSYPRQGFRPLCRGCIGLPFR